MLKALSGWSVMVALTAALVTLPAATASAQGKNVKDKNETNRLVVPVTGTAAGVGTVAGNVAISRFAIRDSQLVAVGVLTATVTDATGTVVRTIVTPVAVPVIGGGSGAGMAPALAAGPITNLLIGSCDILHLVLGPLHLDLLGLVIDLNQVVLDITAQTGAGNLLGNLLCAITGLLDGGVLGQLLVNLLNQLIDLLGSL